MGNGVEAASLTGKVELTQRTCSLQHTIHRKAVKLVSSSCKMASFTQCFEVETVKSAIFATDMNTSCVFIRELKQQRRQQQRKRHLRINIWEMATILLLL